MMTDDLKSLIEKNRVPEDDLQDEIIYLSERVKQLESELSLEKSKEREEITIKTRVEMYEPDISILRNEIYDELDLEYRKRYKYRFKHVLTIVKCLVSGYDPMSFGEIRHLVSQELQNCERDIKELNE